MANAGLDYNYEKIKKLQILIDSTELVQPDLKIQCVFCSKVPVLHYASANCPHIICKSCRTIECKEGMRCSKCGMEITLTYGGNALLTKEIYKAEVYCPFRKTGCQEKVQILELVEHATKCQWSIEALLPKLYTGSSLDNAVQHINDELTKLASSVKTLEEKCIANEDKWKTADYKERQLRRDFESKLSYADDKLQSALNAEMIKSSKQLLESGEHIIELKQKVHTSEKEILELKKYFIESQGKIHDLETKIVDQVFRQVEVLQEINKLRNEDVCLSQANDLLKKENADLKKVVKSLEERITSQENKYNSFDLNGKQLGELESKLKFADEKLQAALNKERIYSTKQLAASEVKIQDLRKQVIKSNEKLLEMEKLPKKQVDASQIITELRKKCAEDAGLAESNNQKLFSEMQKQISCLKDDLLEATSTVFIWKIDQITQNLDKLRTKQITEIYSDVFIIKEYGYKMQATLTCGSIKGFISINFDFVWQKGLSKPSCPSIYFHRRTCILLDQNSKDSDKRDAVMFYEPDFGSAQANMFMVESCGPDFDIDLLWDKPSPFVRKNSALFKIIIEPLSTLYRLYASANGILDWKIDSYSKNKEMEEEGLIDCLYSDYFYSSQRGYRMQVALYLDGYGESEGYLSISLCFRRGEWDDHLPLRFPRKVTYTIVNPIMPNNTFVKEIITKRGGLQKDIDFEEFVSQIEVEQKYLIDDTLNLNVVVEQLH